MLNLDRRLGDTPVSPQASCTTVRCSNVRRRDCFAENTNIGNHLLVLLNETKFDLTSIINDPLLPRVTKKTKTLKVFKQAKSTQNEFTLNRLDAFFLQFFRQNQQNPISRIALIAPCFQSDLIISPCSTHFVARHFPIIHGFVGLQNQFDPFFK